MVTTAASEPEALENGVIKVAHIGVLDQHHPVKRRADFGRIVVDLLHLDLRVGLGHAGLRRAQSGAGGGGGGFGGAAAGHGRVHRLGRDELLRRQAAGAFQVVLGIGLLHLGLRRWPRRRSAASAWRTPA